ncbi:MAG: 3-phosphoshikimate 1-carboxyvinyltransferase [Candidatus Omnitrophica bacterium]|nr:3-phosphoshikimate 1-carboxyvinyltransferase [Candidatus Omnitrophota bacterium]
MRPLVLKPFFRLKGTLSFLGDKSIAHRAVILSALSNSLTTIKNFPANKDCLATVSIFKQLGVKITRSKNKSPNITLRVFGKGLHGLKQPKKALFIEGSGTTLRLVLGILAAQNFKTKILAGKTLSLRPMLRVTAPLRLMGAKINARRKPQTGSREEYPPITIQGGNLKPITYRMPLASAQVKSAILLAGLFAKGKTKIIEPIKTRDHTERMLKTFGLDIRVKKNIILINGGKELKSPGKIFIPSDISSAAFFVCLAVISKNALVKIKNISLNPTRIGFLDVLNRMNAKIQVIRTRKVIWTTDEPMGDLIVNSSVLKGTVVKEKEIPSLIDELPILMVTACFAKGKTIFQGVNELRVKETDRIRSMAENLSKMGAKIKLLKTKGREDIVISGVKGLKGVKVKSFSDHRTAMSLVVAGLCAEGETEIDDISCIDKSFPNFLTVLASLRQ